MRKNLKKTLAKVMAIVMAFSLLLNASPASISSAAAKPKLSNKKVTITAKKSKTLTVKGVKAKKIKKTTWSVKKKAIAKLTKGKKTSVTIKGLKKGKTQVTAKVKVGKKTTTLKCTVTVKAAAIVKPTPSATPKNTPKLPVTTNTPKPPTPATPVAIGDPVHEIELTRKNVSSITDISLTSDREFFNGGEEGTGYRYTVKESGYASGMMFNIAGGKTVDISDYDYVEYTVKNMKDLQTSLKLWRVGTNDWNSNKMETYENDDGLQELNGNSPNDAADRTIRIKFSDMNTEIMNPTSVMEPENYDKLICISVTANAYDPTGKWKYPDAGESAVGHDARVTSIKIGKFTENDENDYVSKDLPRYVKITGNRTVEEEKMIQLEAAVNNKNRVVMNKEIEWTTEDDAIATVDDTGLVTGVSAGKVNIKAAVKGVTPEISDTFQVMVYNDIPASMAIRGSGNYSIYTLDEAVAGIEFVGYLLNANGDPVNFSKSQDITVKEANGTGASITEGRLTATSIGEVTLELGASDGFEGTEFTFEIMEGVRADLSKAYNASENRDEFPFTYDPVAGAVGISGRGSGFNNGIGFEFNLPEGITVDRITGVRFNYTLSTDKQLTAYTPGGDSWDSKVFLSGEDIAMSTTETFLATDNKGEIVFDYEMENVPEPTNGKFNFAIGVDAKDITFSLSEVILVY